MDQRDRCLIYALRELHLLLTTDPVMPDIRSINSYMLYQQRALHADVVNKTIERILNG